MVVQVADSNVSTMIGLVAGTLTTLSFVPQVLRCWRRRSAEDLSLAMLLAFTTGVALWDVYGLMLRAWPIIITNAVTLVLAIVLVAMKVGFRSWPQSAQSSQRNRPRSTQSSDGQNRI